MALTPEQQAMDYTPELQDVSRQRKLAEVLMASGLQQPQGQMISGRYVAPSWTQQLNPIANLIAGQAIGNRADTKQTQMAEALRGQKAESLTKFQTLMANPETRTQAMQFAAGNQFLQPLVADMMKPQKLGEGENLVLPSMGGEPISLAKGAEKFQRPIEVNTGNGTQLLDPKTLKPLSFIPKAKGEGESVNPQEAPLRTQFLGQIQPHIQISQAYGKITNAPDTAAGDMSKIFGFMKILDPGSTVREGEYASAEQTRGIPESVVAQYNKAISGRRLTSDQREKFDQAAGDLVTSQKLQFDQQKKFFTNVASNAKANPANVIFDPYEGLNIKVTPPKEPEPTAKNINFFGSVAPTSGWSIKSVK